MVALNCYPPTKPNHHPDLCRGLGAGGAEAISTSNWTDITRCLKVSVLVHPSSLHSNIFGPPKMDLALRHMTNCENLLVPKFCLTRRPSSSVLFKVKLGEKLILQPTGCLKNNLLYVNCCWELTQLAGPIPWHTDALRAGSCCIICWGTVETIPTIQASCWDIGASYRTRWPSGPLGAFCCVDKKRRVE